MVTYGDGEPHSGAGWSGMRCPLPLSRGPTSLRPSSSGEGLLGLKGLQREGEKREGKKKKKKKNTPCFSTPKFYNPTPQFLALGWNPPLPCRCNTFETRKILPGPPTASSGWASPTCLLVMSQLVQAGTLPRNIFSHCLGDPEGGGASWRWGALGRGLGGLGTRQPSGDASQGSGERGPASRGPPALSPLKWATTQRKAVFVLCPIHACTGTVRIDNACCEESQNAGLGHSTL